MVELEITLAAAVQVLAVDIGHGGILQMDTLKRWGASVEVGWGKVRLDPPCVMGGEKGKAPLEK